MKDDGLLKALEYIYPADCDYLEWINVGMALKSEGYDCSVWDSWSSQDPSRYRTGACEKKWATFSSSDGGVTGGTIMKMATDRGYDHRTEKILGWDDYIEYDGDDFVEYSAPDEWQPKEELKTYIKTLFNDDDIIGYVTSDVWMDEGKWKPSKGCFIRTAGEVLADIDKYDDLGFVFGDIKEEAGAWIRFNPLDGNGVKNENVVGFRYALVESDDCSIADQDALLHKLELPIACLVHSGGKSLHAIVKVDADNYNEYRQRVEFLYDYLEKEGFSIDKQNRNPSRLSRMPGVMRNGNRQYLVGTNIGRKSWIDWMDFVEGESDELPGIVNLKDELIDPPALPEELIKGVLRCGHKMILSSSSKAGKSFALMELCVAISEGWEWLGFKCKRGKVLYVNLEIDPASLLHRFQDIYTALGKKPKHQEDIEIWNLRGKSVPLDKLVPRLIRRGKNKNYVAVVIDPIYKVITGDENNASDMGNFCNQFDKICAELECASIYCHHHSKGAQGNKKAMDRASGSGVFARDPDAQLDLIQLELTDDLKNRYVDNGATGWRLECSLREFKNFTPKNIWFEHPLHKVDTKGLLKELSPEGTSGAGKTKNSRNVSKAEQKSSVEAAYDFLFSFNGFVKVKDMAEYLGVDDRTVRNRINNAEDCKLVISNGAVFEKNVSK